MEGKKNTRVAIVLIVGLILAPSAWAVEGPSAWTGFVDSIDALLSSWASAMEGALDAFLELEISVGVELEALESSTEDGGAVPEPEGPTQEIGGVPVPVGIGGVPVPVG